MIVNLFDLFSPMVSYNDDYNDENTITKISSQTNIKGKNKHMLEMVICYFPLCWKIIYLSFNCIVVKEVKLNTYCTYYYY